jgi:NAD(P)-dependent dehydrogenase (short-subunit alcohol dehydrogenase family)
MEVERYSRRAMSASRLSGKRAIVTGASSGIGRAIAIAFADEGAAVAASGRDPDRTEATRGEIERRGGDAIALVADVSQPEGIEKTVTGAVTALGGLDILVNCAGISEVDGWVPVHEHSLEGWNYTLAVNVTAPFLFVKAAIPHLREAGAGAIVNISSIAGTVVLAGNAAYGSSKAALIQLSKHVAVEYARDGIRSNVIAPGEIETPASTRAFALAEEAGTFSRADLLAKYPPDRFGEPEEIAQTAVFLCSDEARFLTGATITVDGAYTCV